MEQIKPDKRYLLANEEDLNINLLLKTNFNDLNEFNNSKLVSLTELFNKERNKSSKYRIYGNINCVSFLTNKKRTQTGVTDFFNDDYKQTGFNLEDFFDLKIFKQTINQNTVFNTNDTYVENLSAITIDSTYKLSFFGFSKNIYNEKIYNFKFDTLNLNPYELYKINNELFYNNYVYLGFIPKNLTVYEKVFLYKDYINTLDVNTELGYSSITFTNSQINNLIDGSNFNTIELFNNFLSAKTYNFFKTYDIKISDNNINLNKRFIRNYLDIGNGDYNIKQKINLDLTKSAFTGNIIYFDREEYLFTEILKKEYVFKLQLIDTYQGANYAQYRDLNYSSYTYTENSNTITIDFYFKFNPFYKIELKKYETTNEEIYDFVKSNPIPPDNAIKISGGTIWRDLMVYGNPENYDFPFLNDTHYYFNDIRFYVKPDLSDKNTATLLKEFGLNFEDQNYIFNKNNFKILPKESNKTC
jgi:hypothetical protein